MTKYLALLLALSGVVLTMAPAPVYAFSGSMTITGFVPGGGGLGPGGTMIPSGEARVLNSAIRTSTIVTAASRSMQGEVVMNLAATAGRTVAGACFATPVSAGVCAGVGMAGWLLLSRIYAENDEWVAEAVEYGGCYKGKYPEQPDAGNFLHCAGSLEDALALWVSTANVIDYRDTTSAYGGYYHIVYTYPTGQQSAMSVGASRVIQIPYTWEKDVCNGPDPIICTHTSGSGTEGVSFKRELDQDVVHKRPATSQDFMEHAATYPLPDEAAQESPVPLPVESPKVVPFVEVIGDPYPGDDTPEKGPWKQDRLKVTENPLTNNPLDVEATPETVEVDNPTTPEDEVPGEEPTDPDTKPEQPEVPSLCEEYPNISACAELGEIDDEEVPRDDVTLEYESEDFGLPSGCPPDVQLGYNGAVFTFGPICEVAPLIRAVVVALAGFVALGICALALRGAT